MTRYLLLTAVASCTSSVDSPEPCTGEVCDRWGQCYEWQGQCYDFNQYGCLSDDVCRLEGRCTALDDGECIAVGDDDCGRARACLVFGECYEAGNVCRKRFLP